MKKIIKKACVVMITLYNCNSPWKNCAPGAASSILIMTLAAVPSSPLKIAKIRYSVPMSLAFVLKSHLTMLVLMCIYIGASYAIQMSGMLYHT